MLTDKQKENLIYKLRTNRTGEEIAYLKQIKEEFLKFFHLLDNEEVVGDIAYSFWIRRYTGEDYKLIEYQKPRSRENEQRIRDWQRQARANRNPSSFI